jgi:hypothetical protein
MSPIYFAIVLSLPLLAQAADIPANPGNYRAQLGRLQPGDTLILAPGTYDRGLPLTGTRGEPGRPIEIRGPADHSAVFTARPCCNTVQLEDVAYVVVRNLTLDGAANPVSHGVASRGPCHDVTIENLRIVNHGGSQQTVGISTKGPAWNWVIRGNTILGAGTGMYLGDSDGSDPFVNGLIEHNVVLDSRGYNLQIKHQAPRPTDVGLPTTPSRTIIRHNVWSKQHNASTGPNARPNVLVGHFPLAGPGADDRYEIHGNVFYENPTHTLFQGEGNFDLHTNVFVNRSGSAINVRPHNDRPREVLIHHNTVLAADRGIRVAGGDPAHRQRVIGNAVFAERPIEAPDQAENVTGPRAAAGQSLIAPDEPLGQLDLHPKPGRLTGPPIDPATLGLPPGPGVDFDGRPRSWTVRGAYETAGGGHSPIWGHSPREW